MPKDPLLPKEVGGPDKIGPTAPIGEESKSAAPGFQSFMQEPTASATKGAAAPLQSPFDLAQTQSQRMIAGPNLDTLLTQANTAQMTLGDISSHLTTPNLKLRQSQKYLLRNKLSDANAHLRSADAKMGATSPVDIPVSPNAGPIDKFLNYVTNGQNLLDSAKQQLNDLKDKGKNLSPADMLTIQVKLNMAQQSLEYSSVLLSKAVDDLRTLMNIQI